MRLTAPDERQRTRAIKEQIRTRVIYSENCHGRSRSEFPDRTTEEMGGYLVDEGDEIAIDITESQTKYSTKAPAEAHQYPGKGR